PPRTAVEPPPSVLERSRPGVSVDQGHAPPDQPPPRARPDLETTYLPIVLRRRQPVEQTRVVSRVEGTAAESRPWQPGQCAAAPKLQRVEAELRGDHVDHPLGDVNCRVGSHAPGGADGTPVA